MGIWEFAKQYFHWNQDTPAMQLTAINQAIAGLSSNIADEIGNLDEQALHLQRHAVELQYLAPFLKQGHW